MHTVDLTPRRVASASDRFIGGTRGPRRSTTKPTRPDFCPFGGLSSQAFEPWITSTQGYGLTSAIILLMPLWRARVPVMTCCFVESRSGRGHHGAWKASNTDNFQIAASPAPGPVTPGPASLSVTPLHQWHFGAWLVGSISMKRDASAVSTSAGGPLTSGRTHPGRPSWTGCELRDELTCLPAPLRSVEIGPWTRGSETKGHGLVHPLGGFASEAIPPWKFG